jgi:DNA-binding MarR family transcriptional regulator
VKRVYARIEESLVTAPDSRPDPAAAWQRTACYATALRRADRALSRVYDHALRAANLTTPQFSLLSLLNRAPHDLTLSELADAQAMDRTTLSRNLTPLAREGYVTISSGRDRRRRIARLTPAGRDALQQARPLWEQAQARIAHEHGLARMHELLTELDALSAIDA